MAAAAPFENRPRGFAQQGTLAGHLARTLHHVGCRRGAGPSRSGLCPLLPLWHSHGLQSKRPPPHHQQWGHPGLPASQSTTHPDAPEELPAPTHIKIVQAEFVKSSSSVQECPPEQGPEFALVGRSNVGKSSLINALTGRRALAKVSKTPGKTKLINHFLINESWYLVDLPGYGYAKESKKKRIEWNKFTREYFSQRGTLANVLLLVDASVPVQQIDVDCSNWLGDSQVPFSIVFTKMDKRKKKCPPVAENIKNFKTALLDEWEYLPQCIETSGKTLAGKDELLRYLAQLRVLFSGNQ
eukprot:evm.model.scf_415.5 EVM.evm.TU.scf_415.5   scf_415:37321-39182(-)